MRGPAQHPKAVPDAVDRDAVRGLPPEAFTIPRGLKPEYATALVGKWHLGHVAPHWPPQLYGFDAFWGLPYSHDMFPLALMHNTDVIEEPAFRDTDIQRARLALRYILEHPDEGEAMGRRGRHAVQEKYNWECEGAKLVQMYDRILNQ